MAKCAVTGGSGFIGSHVVDALKEAGHDVVVIDHRVRPHRTDVGFEDVDLLDLSSMISATKGCEHIFHLAAVSDVNYAFKYPVYTTSLNVQGTVNILEAARIHQAKRVYLASTVWVYAGSKAPQPIAEDSPFYLAEAGHIYTASKMAAEMLCHNYQQLFNVPTTIFRYGIPYGPRMREALLIPIFLKKAFNNQPLTVAGQGEQFRNFLYVTDMAKAHVLGMKDEAAGQIYNLEGPDKITVKQVAEAVIKASGRKIGIEYTPARPGDYGGKEVSAAKAAKELGWKTTISFEDGVKRTADFFRQKWDIKD